MLIFNKKLLYNMSNHLPHISVKDGVTLNIRLLNSLLVIYFYVHCGIYTSSKYLATINIFKLEKIKRHDTKNDKVMVNGKY